MENPKKLRMVLTKFQIENNLGENDIINDEDINARNLPTIR
jgi:hypothetical protein